MRLLNVHTLDFREYHGNVPKYAIASHRWSADSEATFKDVRRKRRTDRSGHQKILAFTQYVRDHIADLDWIWIDTCCIDEKSSQEVSEAINSMFKWYSNAEICLAYLADVKSVQDVAISDWWTRGWTLQELLAPRTVVFLTQHWQVAGNKGGDKCHAISEIGCSLEVMIASLTGIPLSILQNYDTSVGVSVNEKLAWAANRSTTREEDLSYCLFGIFGVAIGANYGEGKERARIRLLREINEESAFLTGDVPLPPPRSDISVLPLHDPKTDKQVVQRLMESLKFPQMYDRRDSIQSAHEGTFRWALLSTSEQDLGWDNFATWLSDPEPEHRLYWVNAKPGAGKSGLIRFLDEELQANQQMQPWAGHLRVLRLSYYFWNPGNALQKSLVGVLRTILHQLFDAIPESLAPCVPHHKEQLARHMSRPDTTWSEIELRDCFRKAMTALQSTVKILVLVDGLDEIDGDDDTREDLVEFMQEMARYSNVKLCVSSRRWPLFQDAFAICPQLRLEDLNAHDIEQFVNAQLEKQSRFRIMPERDALVRGVIAKADGVFLWTRLVVKDLIRGIRDGDSIDMLQQKLHIVPGDLNEYFTQLLHSIEPHHRMEAGILLQLALHEEEHFIALNPLRLLDLVFIGHAGTDFTLSEHREEYLRLFDDTDALIFSLDSTLRRLASRCKGLLQCNLQIPGASYRAVTALPSTVIQILRQNKHMAFHFKISFMHRSLRDYLLESEPQGLLAGDFDARNYLRNARLMLLLISMHATPTPMFDIGLASYFMCTLSIPVFRAERRCAQFAAAFRPVIESVMQDENRSFERYWYICRSLDTWEEDRSNFLTLAIDFGLTGYIAQKLTAGDVREKTGRPLLDYVLRPRFANGFDASSIGNHFPMPELVQYLLRLGADPNKEANANGASVWTLFLNFVAEYDYRYGCADGEESEMACATSIEHMIKGGASIVVPHAPLSLRLRTALASTFPASQYAAPSTLKSAVVSVGHQRAERVVKPGAASLESHTTKPPIANNLLPASENHNIELSGMVPVEDVLECMRPGLGNRVDELTTLVRRSWVDDLEANRESPDLEPAP